jgi:hypothetical protein
LITGGQDRFEKIGSAMSAKRHNMAMAESQEGSATKIFLTAFRRHMGTNGAT